MGPLLDPTPRPTEASILGGALGQGIAKNFPQPEQMVQRGLLQEAFDKLDPNLSYEQQLASIAPTLLTTQGGAEALQTLAPILQQRAKNRAISEAIRDQMGGAQQPSIGVQSQPTDPSQAVAQPPVSAGEVSPQQVEVPPPQGEVGEGGVPFTSEQEFRHPVAPSDPENIFPESSAGPKKTPLMSPQEMQNYTLGLLNMSDKTGSPMTYQEATQLTQTEQQNREAFNQRIDADQKLRQQNIKDLNADVVNRGVNSGLIQDEEGKTVAEKLGYQARNAENPAKRWEFVRAGLRKFNTAREGLRRESEIPGHFGYVGRNIIGTYKDKETVQRDVKPFVDVYKKYGLYDEIRDELTASLGFGPEDAEMTIFPLTKEENNSIGGFAENTSKPMIFKRYEPYPGSGFNIKDPEKFDKFKDDLSDYLQKFPEANLVTLRGRLNQDKRYSWNDISRAIGELQKENRFTADNYQFSQLPIIDKAPLPGLAEQFKEWWRFTK